MILASYKNKKILKVKEINEMIDKGLLKYDQSTQRRFIYSETKIVDDDGEISRAGNVIRSILQYDIKLPALFFWENGDGTFNIHDGKQRILSLYYFINPNKGNQISTRVNGEAFMWDALKIQDQEKLLNYEFDIVYNNGNNLKEEDSFFLINTNSLPLTPYESLRGCLYGEWIYGFEAYIEGKAKTLDKIQKIGRGDQAILFLWSCFCNVDDIKKSKYINNKILRDNVKWVRNNKFDFKKFKLDTILNLFSIMSKIIKSKPEKLIQIVKFIVDKGWDWKKIINYYENITSKNNDVSQWDFDTHKKAICNLIQENIICDGRRFFNDDEKGELYKSCGKCAIEGCNETNFSRLVVDHIKPWSNGGKTKIENAQLLCKFHNSQKKDNDNEEN